MISLATCAENLTVRPASDGDTFSQCNPVMHLKWGHRPAARQHTHTMRC